MRLIDFLLLLVTLFLWGGNLIAGKFIVEIMPPFFLTSLRFLLVAAVLLPFSGRPNLSMKQMLILSVMLGSLNFGGSIVSVAWGLEVNSAIVLGQLGVPFSCMFGAIMLKDKLGPWRTMGLVIAMLGAVMAAGTPNIANNYPAFLAYMVSIIAWGYSNILLKKYGEVKIFPFLAWIGLFTGLQMLGVSFIYETGQMESLQQIGLPQVGSLIYLSIGVIVVANGIWYYLLNRYVASRLTPFTMLGPFISFTLSDIFLDEEITRQIVIAAIVSIIGVSIIVMRQPKLGFLGKVVPHKLRRGQKQKDDGVIP